VKRLCIIGGAGFIGSHLVRLLIPSRSITVIGRNPAPTRPLPAEIQYLAGDYGDGYFLRGALQRMDEVIVLAHSTVPKTSFDEPVSDILSNLPTAVTLFETAAEYGIKKLVFVSSGGTVYGKSSAFPIVEEHATNPISPYGITKLAIEKYALMYKELKQLPALCVRPANAYGEGQFPFSGQGFVAAAIASVLKQRDIVIFGEEGTIRDYIHVADVASGIAAALEHGVPGSCYNIGTGVGRSNRDVVKAITPFAEAAGLAPKIAVQPSRSFDVPVSVLDSSKLAGETGWKPEVPFEEGIARTWRWLTSI
jgi:UDP-glucose 4-epimerase